MVFIGYLVDKPLSKLQQILFYAITGFISTLALTPSVVSGVVRQGEVFAIEFGNGSIIYALWLLFLLINTFRILIVARKSTDVRSRQQVSFLLKSLILGLGIIVSLNFVLPVLLGAFQLTQIGIFGTLILVGALMYSMAKHQLFDIRLVVVRAVGYVLSLATLVALYGAVIYVVMQILLGTRFSTTEQVVISVSVALAGLFFQPIKKFFDRITSTIFYRDSYDSQEVFDKLNKLLVSSLDLEVLMGETTNIISQYLRPEFCAVGLKKGDEGYRIFGSLKKLPSDEAILYARKHTKKIHHSVIISDYLGPEHAELQQIMRSNDIAALVRLTQNTQKSEEGEGYIIMGYRKSGNPYSESDVRTLEAVANELVLAIQNALHYEEIQNFNTTLQQQINEATRKLRRTNEKLKALDEAKDDFVSMASHQLRTPLTSIKGYTSMVLEGDAGKINATQRRLLEQSFASSQRMVYLIADLLNVSRLKTGKFIIEEHPVNIAEVVEQEIGQLKEAAAGRSLELEYIMPVNFPSVMLDETKTRQVIMNFIDNAIYYTPAGGKITVALAETPASIEFRVIDNGIGVPKNEQQHLFTKFYRAGNARTARPDGTGLGLFMAKKVVIAQGGALIFHTEEGKGSTFGFIFSKSKTPEIKS